VAAAAPVGIAAAPSVAPITAQDAAKVRGKKLRIVTFKAGDTIDSLSRQMAYTDAQRDRFMMRISMGYPDAADEALMLRQRDDANPLDALTPVITVN
jgi:predicted Zn-dependent protease